MSLRYLISTIVCVLFTSSPALGEELDKASQEALQKTTEMLNSKGQRDQYIQRNQKAKQTDAHVTQIAGSEQNKQAIYSLASKIMKRITQQTKGDNRALEKMVKEAQSNPEAFANQFTEEEKQMLRKISSEILKTNPTNP